MSLPVCYGGNGGRFVIEVAALCMLGAVSLIVAGWVWFGEAGLVVGLAVFGLACIGLASVRAGKVRRGVS